MAAGELGGERGRRWAVRLTASSRAMGARRRLSDVVAVAGIPASRANKGEEAVAQRHESRGVAHG